MTKGFKFFFLTFLLSLPFWWGVNVFQKNLEDFLFWKKMADNPQLLTAQIAQEEKLAKLKPIRNWQVENLEIKAESAISVLIDPEGKEKILFEKEIDKKLPIASLTKLMTANVVLEYYDIEKPEISQFLYSLLIASENRAASSLAEIIGQEAFVGLMNLETKKLRLKNTYFANPTGLDPKITQGPINYSTAEDLAKFAEYLTSEKPLIWEISVIPEYKNATNTNELLNEIPGIIGGKTGETPKAGKCFLLVVKAPKGRGFIINVILNSENRFEEMKKLIEWIKLAYKW